MIIKLTFLKHFKHVFCIFHSGTGLHDCADILALDPESETGQYWILLPVTLEPKRVWCDMDTDGGGWTVSYHWFRVICTSYIT